MSHDLDRLVEFARKYRNENVLGGDEEERQIRSFAFGNTHLENSKITKDDIDQAVKSLRKDQEHTPVRS